MFLSLNAWTFPVLLWKNIKDVYFAEIRKTAMALASLPQSVRTRAEGLRETVQQGKCKDIPYLKILNMLIFFNFSDFVSFGVCCIFVVNDANGGQVNYNCSYIQNPNYPSAQTVASTFSYTVNKCDDGQSLKP